MKREQNVSPREDPSLRVRRNSFTYAHESTSHVRNEPPMERMAVEEKTRCVRR